MSFDTLSWGWGTRGERGVKEETIWSYLWEKLSLKLSWLTCGKNTGHQNKTPVLIPLCARPERAIDRGMAGSSSLFPRGVGKTDPVSVSQLAWCGAVTASPSSAQSVSQSQSAGLQLQWSGRSSFFSGVFVWMFFWRPDNPFNSETSVSASSVFPIQGCDSALNWSHHRSSGSSCLQVRPVSLVIVLLAQRHSYMYTHTHSRFLKSLTMSLQQRHSINNS